MRNPLNRWRNEDTPAYTAEKAAPANDSLSEPVRARVLCPRCGAYHKPAELERRTTWDDQEIEVCPNCGQNVNDREGGAALRSVIDWMAEGLERQE